MPPVFRSRAVLGCIALSTIAMIVIGFVPLFGGPGYESAVAAGLILPSIVAIATAFAVSREASAPGPAFVRGVELAVIMAAFALVTILIHGVRAGFCDVGSGLALFALGPLVGSWMGAAWGVVVGQVALSVKGPWRRRLLCVVAGPALPGLGAIVSLLRFYTSPMVFAFDPFFGFFSGTVYDTVVTDSLPRLLTYRAGSAATLFAFGAASFLLTRDDAGKLRIAPRRHPGLLWFVVASAAASLIVSVEGARLGHWQTASTIATQLGGRIVDERCEVIYPRSLSNAAARLLLRDCATQSRQVSAFLGVDNAPQVRVYYFASREQKRELTGAANTSIAKPWRREVYVNAEPYPHPVLGHELAHVLAGSFARGPFNVAGGLGGWLPNPGLIEGIAVAASPDDDELTPQQWSSAMKKIGALPPLSTVFALDFLGENSSVSYTVAGAFVEWIRQRYGGELVRRWYGGESLEAITSQSQLELEKAWLSELDAIELSPAALEFAKARFDRPGVFQRKCPHAVDAFNARGRELAGQGDCVGASMEFDRAWSLDSNHYRSRMGLASCASRIDGPQLGRQQWQNIADDGLMPSTVRSRAREAVADSFLAEGDGERAASIYESLRGDVIEEDRLRTLDVKLRAARNPFEARAVTALLIGDLERGADPILAFTLLGKWMVEVPGDGLPAYLIGRNLALQGSWLPAAEFLDWSLERDLSDKRVVREALRVRLIVACALRDETTARRMYARWRAQSELAPVRWQVLERRLGRCITTPGEGTDKANAAE